MGLFTLLFTLLMLMSASTLLNAEPITAIADDGREVILLDNGEWTYATDDVFATTPDGQRIRLKPNQKWQKISGKTAPVYQPVAIAITKRDSITVNGAKLILDQIRIENSRENVGKNKRLRSQIVLYVDMNGSLPLEALTVQDSKGRTYPVVSVSNGVAPVGGGTRTIIRASGAPKWWGVKFFSLQIAEGAIGNSELIELRKPMRDVISVEVESLPK